MTPPAPAPPSTDTVALANRLRPVLLHIGRHMRRELHALGLTSGQVEVLVTVRDNPGIGVGDLATRQSMSAPSMCTHIDRLEIAGMVTRTRDIADKRRVGLTITPRGERTLRDVRSRRTAWLAARLSTMDGDALARIDSAVDALSALVET